ncbi:MAG: glycosyltransferase [Terracidiphilus sp.]
MTKTMLSPTFDMPALEQGVNSSAKMQNQLPGVLIYSPQLLPTVQHYVREHASRLRRYRPVLAGRRHVHGTPFGEFESFTFPSSAIGWLREFNFLLTGIDSELASFIRRHRIDLIHAHFGPGGTEIISIAARLGIPLVVTFHGWDVKLGAETTTPTSPYERLYRRRLPWLFRDARKLICVSSSLRNRVLALGCPPDKTHTNYLGVDSTLFDGIRSSFDPTSILFVGRLVRQKGVRTLLEALQLLRDRVAGVHLTIVGEGPEQGHLERIVTEQHLPVRLVGKRDSTEIRELLRTSAVLCAPSTTAGGELPEALGLVVLEAQAMSVPVVATRNGGIPEAMEDGKTGLLVDEESPAALADALAKLLGDPPMNWTFGKRARNFVCDRFDITRCYSSLEDIYDGIMSTARAERAANDNAATSRQATYR